MHRTPFQWRVPVIAIGACCALLTCSAHASAAQTIGSSLSGLDGQSVPAPTGGAALVQQLLPGRAVRASFDGVIVRWRIRGTGDFGLAAGNYVATGWFVRQPGTAVQHAGSLSRTETFASRRPIAKGQYIMLMMNAGASVAVRRNVSGSDLDAWVPIPPRDRATQQCQSAQCTSDNPFEAGFNADIERDADGDGFGDETQDECPTNPLTQGPCQTPAPPPPATPPAAPPAPDTTAPMFLSRPSIHPRRFRANRGARITVALSESARVVVFVERIRYGRRGHRKCVLARNHGQRCRTYRSLGTLVRRLPAGAGTIRVRHWVAGHRLRRGAAYRATLVAADGAGNRSAPFRLRFGVR